MTKTASFSRADRLRSEVCIITSVARLIVATVCERHLKEQIFSFGANWLAKGKIAMSFTLSKDFLSNSTI